MGKLKTVGGSVIIATVVFIALLFSANEFIDFKWLIPATFFVFVPVSNWIAKKITGIGIYSMLFK